MASNTLLRPTRFFTTPSQDADTIQAWLEEHVYGVKPKVFYASFINWCIATVMRVRNPGTKYKSDAEKQQNTDVFDGLHTHPADTATFVGLMEMYMKRSFQAGNLKKGFVDAAQPTDMAMVEAQKRLHEHVFTKDERREIAKAHGTEMPHFDQLAKARRERKMARRQQRAADGTGPLTLSMAGVEMGEGDSTANAVEEEKNEPEAIREDREDEDDEDEDGWRSPEPVQRTL